ncbi:MAG: 2-oxoacid:acceptor oxidoreductase family protein [Armatimonadota bacterium]
MRQVVIIAGTGGQGVVSAGEILAQVAHEEGYGVTYMTQYSPEVRGGWVAATVVLGDGQVGSPVAGKADTVLLLSNQAAKEYRDCVKKDGLLIVNTSLAEGVRADGERLVEIPATETAQEIGDERATNMLMLGAYSEVSGVVSLDSAEHALKSVLPERHHDSIPANMKALRRGAQLVRENIESQ